MAAKRSGAEASVRVLHLAELRHQLEHPPGALRRQLAQPVNEGPQRLLHPPRLGRQQSLPHLELAAAATVPRRPHGGTKGPTLPGEKGTARDHPLGYGRAADGIGD